MELNKTKKLGAILELVLRIGLIIGIIFLMCYYSLLEMLDIEVNLFLLMVYPCGLSFLGLVNQFIGMFGLLKINNPFSKETITYLRKGMYISFIISFLVAISLSILIINNLYVLAVKLCIGFICVLFFGVGIALYLLKELFKEALQYKEENELTI